MELNDMESIHAAEAAILFEIDRICRAEGIQYFLAYGTALGAARNRGFISWDTDADIMVTVDAYSSFLNAMHNSLGPSFKLHYRTFESGYDELFLRIGANGHDQHLVHVDVFPIAGAPSRLLARKLFSLLAYVNYRCYSIMKSDPTGANWRGPVKKQMARLLRSILIFVPTSVFVRIFEMLSRAYPLNDSEYVGNICGSYGMREFFPRAYLDEVAYLEFESRKLPVLGRWHEYLSGIYGDYMTPRRGRD